VAEDETGGFTLGSIAYENIAAELRSRPALEATRELA
jgi:hypothetical protein